jgi:spermidine synthase
MGYTLRAALDQLPHTAHVVVAELTEQVLTWCQGPLAPLCDQVMTDPRVEIRIDNVARVIKEAKSDFDAIIFDLYEGPCQANLAVNKIFYGSQAIHNTQKALKPKGIWAVWSEDPDPPFEKRLRTSGFRFERIRSAIGARRHVVYLAQKKS